MPVNNEVALVLFFRTTGGQTFVHRRLFENASREVYDDVLARHHADDFIARLGESLRATSHAHTLPPVNVVSSADHVLSVPSADEIAPEVVPSADEVAPEVVPSAVRPLARKRKAVSKFTYRRNFERRNFEPARGFTHTDAKQFGPKARAKRRSAWAKRAQARKAKKVAREAELREQGKKAASLG